MCKVHINSLLQIFKNNRFYIVALLKFRLHIFKFNPDINRVEKSLLRNLFKSERNIYIFLKENITRKIKVGNVLKDLKDVFFQMCL